MAEPCSHPIEVRQESILGGHHYCPACDCVLTPSAAEPVVIKRAVYRRG